MKITRKPGQVTTLRQTISALDKREGRVGWFESAKYEGGQPVAGVAYVQEHGSPSHGIPPRSFFRPTAADKQTEWAATAGKLTRAAAQGKFDPTHIMEAIALAAEGHVRAAIVAVTEPPLKEATVAARKRKLANEGAGAKSSINKPLVASGLMLATLTTQVK